MRREQKNKKNKNKYICSIYLDTTRRRVKLPGIENMRGLFTGGRGSLPGGSLPFTGIMIMTKISFY